MTSLSELPPQDEVTARLRTAAEDVADQYWSFSARDVFVATAGHGADQRRYRLPRTRPVRVAASVLVAAVIVLVFFAPLPQVHLFGSGTAPTTKGSHHRSTLSWAAADFGPAEFDAVACPTQTQCFGLGPAGWEAWSDDGGQSWTTSVEGNLKGATFTRVVCPSSSMCVAIGGTDATASQSGRTPAAVAVSFDGGRHWQRESMSGPVIYMLGGLACPTTRVCYATATVRSSGGNGLLLESTDGGLTWNERLAGPRNGLNGALSCPQVGHCWAAGGPYGMVATTDGGTSWTAERGAFGAGGYPGITELDCLSLARCVGVGIELSPGYPVIVVTDNGGSSWHFTSGVSSLAGNGGSFNSVSCTVSGRCVAVGRAYLGDPVVAVSNDGGDKWQVPGTSLSFGYFLGVSCAAQSGCVAVGSTQNGAALIAASPSTTSWTTRLQGVGSEWSSVSCPTIESCVAVGSDGQGAPNGAEVLTTSDGGIHWVQRNPPGDVVAFSGVDCPSASRCFATAYVTPPSITVREGTPWMAALLRSDDGGRTWRREPLAEMLILTAVSCPTTTTCFAVGATDANGAMTHDAVVRTVDGGASWTDQPVPTPVGAFGLYAISCPSALRCWAAGQYGVLATKNGGRTWFDQPVPGDLQAIACPSERLCVAVSNGSASVETPASPIFLTVNGGRSWSNPSSPVADLVLTGVTCPASSECLSVGSSSRGATVLASFDGGRRWALQQVPSIGSSAAYDTVRCAETYHCVALGGGPVAEFAVGR